MNEDLQSKCSILSELWMNYRTDGGLKDFVEYNDMGLPLAYLLYNEIVLPTEEAEFYINETYYLFVAALGIEDREYQSLDEMLAESNKHN